VSVDTGGLLVMSQCLKDRECSVVSQSGYSEGRQWPTGCVAHIVTSRHLWLTVTGLNVELCAEAIGSPPTRTISSKLLELRCNNKVHCAQSCDWCCNIYLLHLGSSVGLAAV